MGTSLHTSARELRYLPPPALAGVRAPAWKGALVGVLLAHVLLDVVSAPPWGLCGTWCCHVATASWVFVSLFAAAGGAVGNHLRGLAWRPLGIVAGASVAILWQARYGNELVLLCGVIVLCTWVNVRLVPLLRRRRSNSVTRSGPPLTGARAHLAIAARSRTALAGALLALYPALFGPNRVLYLSLDFGRLVRPLASGYALGLLVALALSYAGHRGGAGRHRQGGGPALLAGR